MGVELVPAEDACPGQQRSLTAIGVQLRDHLADGRLRHVACRLWIRVEPGQREPIECGIDRVEERVERPLVTVEHPPHEGEIGVQNITRIPNEIIRSKVL